MTKKEIVRSIADSLGISHKKTREIVQCTFDTIVEIIIEEGRIELRNFGIFEVKKRAARKAHNPKTGEEVQVPEKYVVTFKPGKFMEERVAKLAKKTKK
jgi:nucleoid DNA-binding protein